MNNELLKERFKARCLPLITNNVQIPLFILSSSRLFLYQYYYTIYVVFYFTLQMKKLLKILLLLLLIGIGFYAFTRFTAINDVDPVVVNETIAEDGVYTSKDEVALYIHTYSKLPSNYVSKSEAKNMGWVANKGNLLKVCDGCSIGGDKFTNREGNLPKKKGRQYYECDIDYTGGTRNAKRIVYSNDGLIYYTDDHYNTFELLYGDPNE